ncbi:MAG TPA: hypothetical protein VML19_08330 [Verrucomicrobiae bacterium]|nr:hypothetical protein [Verrucomicrobiae bacterium]
MDLIAGLWTPAGVADAMSARARSFTISWLRWGYRGQILEAGAIDPILQRAADSAHEFCLVQRAGSVIREQSGICGARSRPFFEMLDDRTAHRDFLMLGWRGRCFLVNLEQYRQRGRPPFAEFERAARDFPPELAEFLVDTGSDLTGDPEFLRALARQAENGARGVFVLNFESYRDIEPPLPGWEGPISVLYSVGAGLKPNRILDTHGLDDRTRVVYFDYSAAALRFRRLLYTEWDGRRYPDFLRSVFERMPAPDTHYFLWPGADPANLDWAEMERLWATETGRWGGEDRIAAHWKSYRRLNHEFRQCNILTGYRELLETIGGDGRPVIWWSNAFSTIFSACHYTLDERRERYEDFIARLSDHAPQMLIYGSDHSNSPVNGMTASEYWKQYRDAGGDPLAERRLYRHAMRY